MPEKTNLKQLLSEYHPQPGKRFYQKMENAPWLTAKEEMNPVPTHRLSLGWKAAIALVLILAVMSFAIPTVRASISAWLGLSVAPSNRMPADTITLVALTPPTAQATRVSTATGPAATSTAAPTASQPVPTELSQIAPQVNWALLTPSQLPTGYKLDSVYLDTNDKMVVITYTIARELPGGTDTSTQSITFMQALTNDFVPMEISPDASVTDVTVNGQAAAYVIGAWDTQFEANTQEPNGGKMVSTWRNDLNNQNLFWQVGKVYVTLITDDNALTQQDLIAMAASIGR